DELAFWYDEYSANPDKEMLVAVRPAMLTIKDSLLIGLSSPHARRGLLYEKYKQHFGRDDAKALVWQAPTADMNPDIDPDELDALTEELGPAAASAEIGAMFRDDISSFISEDALLACVDTGVRERAWQSQWSYQAFIDPSGLRSDSFTAAIVHKEWWQGTAIGILDALREYTPAPGVTPQACVEDIAALLRSYRIRKCLGDRYAGEWPVEAFRKYGITYEQAARPKSEQYAACLPLLNSARVRLLDHKP